MNPLKEYHIPFLGLKLGKHAFEFHLTEKFFDVFEFSEIHTADIAVHLDLEKKPNMMTATFLLQGTVQVCCDHCGDPLQQTISARETLHIKFGDVTSELSDDVLILGPQEYELDISQYLYEYAHVSLPVRNVHEDEKQCNQQVLQSLSKYRVSTTANTQWAELKNLNYEDPEDNPLFNSEEEE